MEVGLRHQSIQVNVKEKYDIDGEEEEISILQEDLLKLIME